MRKIHVMTLGVYGALLIFLTLPPAQASTERKDLLPVAHEELGNMLDELVAHFRGLGTQMHRHFRGLGQRRQRALITFMLRHRDELELSTDQVKSLRKLRSDFERAAIRRQADIRVAEMDLETLLDAETVDLEKVEPKIRQIEKLRADHRLTRIRTIEEGKAQLSSEQRKKLQTLLSANRYPWDTE